MNQTYITPIDKVVVGTKLKCDAGFLVDDNGCGCLQPDQIVEVKQLANGELYVDCRDGQHGLDGQLDDAGENYVGFLIVEKD
jgi:hypothetical protein